ncbi:hypothetical protein AYO47_04145 [Planctomyces sp. SCGC AG-212-M04]|nr:hypothetical protein AYO47_04145 [Planctomyces sp. SCGC AG-212-M04]
MRVIFKMEVVQMSLENSARIDGDSPSWQTVQQKHNCIKSALTNLLSVAAETFASTSEAAAWLVEHNVPALLRSHKDGLSKLIGFSETEGVPVSTWAGNYLHIVFAHLAWTLSDHSLGEWYVATAIRADNCSLSTPFWREYARALSALVHGEQYERKELKLRSLERYWVTYLSLIEAATQGVKLGIIIAEVREAFAKRNRDKRIRDDNYEVEGSAIHPVQWDFRLEGLLGYIAGGKR